jgi:hypothetical protein
VFLGSRKSGLIAPLLPSLSILKKHAHGQERIVSYQKSLPWYGQPKHEWPLLLLTLTRKNQRSNCLAYFSGRMLFKQKREQSGMQILLSVLRFMTSSQTNLIPQIVIAVESLRAREREKKVPTYIREGPKLGRTPNPT